MSNVNIPTMLTVKEVAKRTNLSEIYIRQLVWDDKIVYVKSGKKYLINFEKLIKYLNGENVKGGKFTILDGSVNTLPAFNVDYTIQDFLNSNEGGSDYGREFKSISYFIENLILLDDMGNSHVGCLGISFRLWLDDNSIEKEPLIFANYDDSDDYLIEYWYPNLYKPDIPQVRDVDENLGEIRVIGWRYK